MAVCTVNGHDRGAILVREGLAISELNYGDPSRREERQARDTARGSWPLSAVRPFVALGVNEPLLAGLMSI